MKKIALSLRVDWIESRNEKRDAIDQRLVQWMISADMLPILVPNQLETAVLKKWLQAVSPEGIILSGGNDVGQCPERDQTERNLLDWAKAEKKPVLGICRGLQMMAVWAGGDLKSVDGHIKTRHLLKGEINTEVNSFHGFGLATCPPGFLVTAQAEDGEIEAIRHPQLKWEGWMWHPEREEVFSRKNLEMLKTVFQ